MTEAADTNAVVTKGQFADIVGVSAGRVSQYIAEGKISGSALIGEGRRAKIHVANAREQLRRHLDIGQMLGNGLETKLSDPATGEQIASDTAPQGFEGEPSKQTLQPSLPTREDTVEDKLKRERLFQEQIRSRKAAAEEEAGKGRFTETEEVRAAKTRIAVEMVQTFEGALPNMAAAIASKFQLPVRDVLHELRAQFTNMRSRAADEARNQAANLPETVVTEIHEGGDQKEAV